VQLKLQKRGNNMPYIGKQPARVPVTASDIPDNSITAAKILDGVITAADIGANAVGTSELIDGAVTAAKLAAGAAVPSQSSHNGKFLTTNGSTASWATISTVFPFTKADGSSDTITITNGEFPFYRADGTQDNIGVS
jgi:hypothetical protein